MLDVPSISAVVAATGVIIGVVFTILELRNLVKMRQTDLIMRLYSTFNSREYQEAEMKMYATEFEDYSDYEKKYGPYSSGKPIHIAANMVCIFFEGLGVLLHRKLIDIDLVADLFAVSLRWEKMKPIVKGQRKQFGEPRILEWFEYLYNEMQKREQRLQQIQQ